MTAAEYVRAIEHHVCQKNDGHLIRIVGPAFEVVTRWERDGIPLKVALRGIDRYFERYYRQGPRRRPVRVEFCEADVVDVFEEWRRAVGAAASTATVERGANGAMVTSTSERHGPSLPAHLQRVLTKLSSARASGRLGPETEALLDRVAEEFDAARARAGGLRGEARRALIDRLAAVDEALLDAVRAALPAEERQRIAAEAEAELSSFRDRMAGDAYARAVRTMSDRILREHVGLPTVRFE